nr:hypothetical protein [Treponema sp.]
DRQKLTDTIDIAKTPAYGLISYLYVAEPETGLLYRNTEIAKNGLMRFYGTSSVEDISVLR